MTAWVDTVMTWNPSNFGGITTIYRRSETIWRSSPFTLWNSITSSTYYALNGSHPIILKYDGTVAMDISGTYAVVCEMDVTFFPWDSHTCQIQIKPSVLDVSGMVIRPANNLVLAAVSSGNSGWSVDTSKVFHYVVNTTVSTALGFPLSANTTIGRVMSVYYLNFTLIRRSKYYMFSIIAPVCINTALSLVALIIPGGNGKRIGLTMTSFLSFSVLQSYVNTLVPRGNTIPLLSQYILSQLTLSAICVVGGVFALLINNVDHEMPAWLKKTSRVLAKVLFVTVADPHPSPSPSHENPMEQSTKAKREAEVFWNTAGLSTTGHYAKTDSELVAVKSINNGHLFDDQSSSMTLTNRNTERAAITNASANDGASENHSETPNTDRCRRRNDWNVLNDVVSRIILLLCLASIFVLTAYFLLSIQTIGGSAEGSS